MEHRFQYHVPFTDQCTEPGPGPGKLLYDAKINIKFYASARTHVTHLIHVHLVMYLTHIYIENMHTKKVSECAVTSERSVSVKIANSNFVPTLRGFRWYPYFVAQEQLVAFEGQANDAGRSL